MKFAPSIIAIDGDISYSKTNVWLWVGIPAMPFEFLDASKRETYAHRFDNALSLLAINTEREIDVQLIVTSAPFNDKEWAEQLLDAASRYDPDPEFVNFTLGMQRRVHGWRFRNKKVYFGLNLGKRSEATQETGVLAPLLNIVNQFGSAINWEDPLVNEKELDFWRNRATVLRQSLQDGNLSAIPVTSNEIANIVKRSYWPGMEVPSSSNVEKEQWGPGELNSLAIAEVENNSKYLKITQDTSHGEKTGYRATLCFSRFPDEMDFPNSAPWIHYASLLSSPVDIYSRFSIVPARKVREHVVRKGQDAKDQYENALKSGNSIPLAIQEQMEVSQNLEFLLERDTSPWVYGRHRIIVEAATLEDLNKNCNRVIEHYKNLQIDVVWPRSDQMRLLLESHPNDKVRVSSYHQRQTLSIISAGVPAGTGSVGDDVTITSSGRKKGWIGPYLGYTTSRVTEPVFLSLHSAIARDNPPGCIITGSPGGGKSFCAFTITYQMALQNIWTIYIDPKADALPMVNLPGLKKPNVFDLAKGAPGILDSFNMADDVAEQGILAKDIIQLFIGAALSANQSAALDDSIWKVSHLPNPTLYKVVDELLDARYEDGKVNNDARSVGTQLRAIRDLPFARLCFNPDPNAKQATTSIRPDQGLTIITLLGLDFPAPTAKTMTTPNRLAVGILYLLTQYTQRLMSSLDQLHPKAVVIDEAWAITSTEQGARLIPSIARMGRSLNTALMLVSQNAGDFLRDGDNLTNNLAIRLAFRSKDVREIDDVLEFFGLEKNEGNRETIRDLRNGECLMRDVDGRIARVQIDGWNEEMNVKFETNPQKKNENANAIA